MISLSSNGSWRKTEAYLLKLKKMDISKILESYGQRGVDALSSATPLETGRAAHAWGYEVTRKDNSFRIIWTNSDVENGFPVVIMLQYGHGTGTGGYVQGQDFINPAIKPIFDEIEEAVRKVVTSA